MNKAWTRMSRRRPPRIFAAVAILLCLLAAAGCAPHRRGPLPAVDSPPPRPSVDAVRPEPRPSHPAPRPDSDATPAEKACALAESFIGTPFRWGGSTPAGFDCSGLVQYIYGKQGVTLPRRSTDQARAGRKADLHHLKPGDLIFFRTNRNVISHVGIHVGGGEFIHAPGTGKIVRRDSLASDWWRKRVMAVRRVF